MSLNNFFTEAEIEELYQEIEKQLNELQHMNIDKYSIEGDSMIKGRKGISKRRRKLPKKQLAEIELITKEDSQIFFRKFARNLWFDLCKEDGQLNKVWRQWGDLNNREAMEKFLAVLTAMGLSGTQIKPVIIAVVVILLNVGVKTICEEYCE